MTRSDIAQCPLISCEPSTRTLRADFVLPRLFDSLGLSSNAKLLGDAQAMALRRMGSGQGERGDQLQIRS